jgi:hypothetical protein
VPPSIRDAALGVGASKMQTVFHHVLPLAMPGILTGTILGLASALGETAPLLLIGMVAFVTNYPAARWKGCSTRPRPCRCRSIPGPARRPGLYRTLVGCDHRASGLPAGDERRSPSCCAAASSGAGKGKPP